MTLDDIETPALVLDRAILKSNIARMARHAEHLGVPMRPHLKTPKSAHVARELTSAGATGFCVSTLREAEYFHEAGFSDLYYCVPFAPAKAGRAAALVNAGCRLILMTDSLEGAQATVRALEKARAGRPVEVTLEIDVDGYRSGLDLSGDELERAAEALDAGPATMFAGIMSYAGASYGLSAQDAGALAASHCEQLAGAQRRLERAGIACSMVSLGSTPAVLHARALPGVSEVRCGIYGFQDLFQAGIGACKSDDIALSVLVCVVSRHPRHNRLVIDAGGLALSKDRSTAGHPFDAAYGWVCDANSGARIGDLWLETVSQEIGLVTSESGEPIDMDRFPVGSRLRILPNHADMTAAAYEEYHIVEGSKTVLETWGRANRW